MQVNNNYLLPRCFSYAFILKTIMVFCFDALLQVLILNHLFAPKLCKAQSVSQVQETKQLDQSAAPESKNAS